MLTVVRYVAVAINWEIMPGTDDDINGDTATVEYCTALWSVVDR